MTGGGGNDVFVVSMPGAGGTDEQNRVTDFGTGADEIAFSSMGFNLGLAGTSTPKALPLRYFSTKTNGTFDLGPKRANERFAYNTANGQLFYDADGNGTVSSRQLVVTLAGAPPLTINDLFYVT